MKGHWDFEKYARFDSYMMRVINRLLCKFSTVWHLRFLKTFGKQNDQWAVDNLVTSAGKAQIALLFNDATATPFTYFALGTSGSAVAVGNTALGAEISTNGLARAVATTIERTTTTVTNDTARLIKTFTASGGAHAVEEIGVFNASSSGTMFSRALSTKSIADGESILCTYTVAFA